MVGVQHSVDELTSPSRFAPHPPCGAGRHVTFDAFHASVGRILICREFGMHGMAGSAAELRSFHVLDGTIGDLGADDYIRKCSDREKPCQAAQGCSAIKPSFT